MISVLLIVIPLVTGLLTFFMKEERSAKAFALLSAVATLAVSLISLPLHGDQLTSDAAWLPMIGSRFSLSLDGMGKMLTLLTAVSFPVIFASTYNNKY